MKSTDKKKKMKNREASKQIHALENIEEGIEGKGGFEGNMGLILIYAIVIYFCK